MKKGSLQLSINAIVVLILAITMLGLGLAFMRGTFGKVTEQFGEISAEVQKDMLNRLKDSGEGLVLNVYELKIRQGEKEEFYIALRNDLGSKATFLIDEGGISSETCTGPDTSLCCISMADSACEDLKISTFPSITLEDGETQVIKLALSAGPRTTKDTYSLPINVKAPDATVPFDKTVRLVVNVE